MRYSATLYIAETMGGRITFTVIPRKPRLRNFIVGFISLAPALVLSISPSQEDNRKDDIMRADRGGVRERKRRGTVRMTHEPSQKVSKVARGTVI